MQIKSKAVLFLLLSLLILSCEDSKKKIVPEGEKVYSLTGTVIDKNTDTLVLYMPNEDPYNQNIKIPVKEGKFKYDFKVDQPIGYDLRFWKDGNPGGRWMTVFLEKSDIELTIYPEDQWEKNTIKGGKITAEWNDFYRQQQISFGNEINSVTSKLQDLENSGNYFSPDMQQLLHNRRLAKGKDEERINKQIDQLRKGNLTLSDSTKIVRGQLDQLYSEKTEWIEDYTNTYINIISYYLFFTELSFRPKRLELDQARNDLLKFTQKFPDHPYNSISETKLTALKEIQIGNPFADFSLPNLSGDTITLSDLIKGKKAVINLWATWCRPCIIKNRELIPVYIEFKDQNFTVVGVAGEYKNTDKLVRFLVKENYPWLNLVELDNKNLIWEKYGISRAGGGLFLVNEKGEIVAIEPSVEEIKQFLENAG